MFFSKFLPSLMWNTKWNTSMQKMGTRDKDFLDFFFFFFLVVILFPVDQTYILNSSPLTNFSVIKISKKQNSLPGPHCHMWRCKCKIKRYKSFQEEKTFWPIYYLFIYLFLTSWFLDLQDLHAKNAVLFL